MSKEGSALQCDMFSGELVDTRSNRQKKKDKERSAPQQTQMFKTPEIVQFGLRTQSAYRDWLNQATAPPLILESQDTRTSDEIEQDLLHEAQKYTIPLFGDTPTETTGEPEKDDSKQSKSLPSSGIVFDAQIHQMIIGLRVKLRTQSLAGKVRRRTV